MKDQTNKREEGLDQGFTVEKMEQEKGDCFYPMPDSEDTKGGFIERNNYYDRI